MDVAEKIRGIFHHEEKFSRLILGTSDIQTEVDDETGFLQPAWKLVHQPLARFYKDAAEYRRVVAPILAHEWKTVSMAFKEKNACYATLLEAVFIENIRVGGTSSDRYWISLEIQKSKVWDSAKRPGIGSMQLELQVLNQRVMRAIVFIIISRLF